MSEGGGESKGAQKGGPSWGGLLKLPSDQLRLNWNGVFTVKGASIWGFSKGTVKGRLGDRGRGKSRKVVRGEKS